MPTILSTETHAIKAIADSHATIRIITESTRVEFRDGLSQIDTRLGDLSMEKRELLAVEPEEKRDWKKIRTLTREIQNLLEDIDQAWVSRFLIGTDLIVDEHPINADNIKRKAPKAFFDEVVKLIVERSELGSAEVKNSESPSTSSAAEVTTKSNTIAEPAV